MILSDSDYDPNDSGSDEETEESEEESWFSSKYVIFGNFPIIIVE